VSHIVGIDLGTTHSLCAIFQNGKPRLIPNSHGEVLTPSVVGVLEDSRIVVGAAARELRVTQPGRCAWCFKRGMGTDGKIKFAHLQLSPIELSSLVLRSLRDDAQAFLGEEVTDAVITVPAYFNDLQRKATKIAGEMAGLNVRRIVNEPTAAALAYGFYDRDAMKKLIVIDLGGGTFDVTAIEVFEGALEIIASSGEGRLGGEDFTDRLVAWALEQEKVSFELAELKQPLRVARLRHECELAKRKLAKEDASVIRLPNTAGEFPPNGPTLKIDRLSFATLVAPIVQRLTRPIHKVLRDSENEAVDFDEAILVGGATRMTVLKEYVSKMFEREPLCSINPDEVVALGAAVQAALLAEHVDVGDMVMTDVCPFTLGVAIAKEFGREVIPGYFLPIIDRNTAIPVSKEEVVSTVSPNQTQILVKVYQGDARKVEDNLFLGELSIVGLPPGPAGLPVRLRFTYDLNGILEVEAFVEATGKSYQTVLAHHAKDLTPKEIDQAVRKMQDIKFYPRDLMENRRLVLYAERVVGELAGDDRKQLSFSVDFFEDSMSSGDRERFDVARSSLLEVLRDLGYPYAESGREENDDAT
jgi:molecular chaperone HscC